MTGLEESPEQLWQRIRGLEQRVRDLEARPVYVPQPVYIPMPQPYPAPQPYFTQPYITCGVTVGAQDSITWSAQ